MSQPPQMNLLGKKDRLSVSRKPRAFRAGPADLFAVVVVESLERRVASNLFTLGLGMTQ